MEIIVDPDINLAGISVGNVPLTQEQLRERKLHSEAMETHREEVRKARELTKTETKERGLAEETKKVSKRVRYWSANEIRERRGLMDKPYKSKIENILWCIANHGPVTLQAIAKIMNMTDPTDASKKLSGPLSTLWRCLGNDKNGADWMLRKSVHGSMEYQLIEDRSVEVLYNKYREVNRVHAQATRKAKQDEIDKLIASTEKPKDMTGELPEREDVDIDPGVPEEGKPDKSPEDTILGAVVDEIGRRYGLDIDLNIKVEVVFGWKGKDDA